MTNALVEQIVHEALSKAHTNVLCIDGTSCCFKTSILLRSGITPVLKVQKSTSFVNANSYGPSMIGYIFSGLREILSMSVPCLMDRSPVNVLEWYILWKLLDIYYNRYGNTNPEVIDCSTFLQKFDQMFNFLQKSYFYKEMRKHLDVIAIVDSDVVRCDRKRRLRNQGSDEERSTWLYYTYLQNRMYKLLYPFIDLAWFNDTSADTVQVIASTIERNIKNMKPRKPIYFKKFKYPTTVVDPCGVDLVLQNFHTYAHREFGRIDVQSVLDELSSLNQRSLNIMFPVVEMGAIHESENCEDYENFVQQSMQLIPKTEFNDNDESEFEMLEVMCN